MGKNLVIGNASGYNWDQVKYWVNSLKKTDYDGNIALCVSDVSVDTIQKFNSEGILTFAYGTKNADGSYSLPKDGTAPHVARFFYMWLVLDKLRGEGYDFVVSTDVRDVIFQKNPVIELPPEKNLIVSSEGMLYKDEPWGHRNILDAYGPFFQGILGEKDIYNVGVVAGRYSSVKNLFLNIFMMSINRPTPIADQASYNMLLHLMMPEDELLIDPRTWSIQLGTTPQAILEGTLGDLALLVNNGSISADDYQKSYHGPLFYDYGGRVCNLSDAEEFAIVHQWDRVPSLAPAVKVLYDV
jgi:hypothetical protein